MHTTESQTRLVCSVLDRTGAANGMKRDAALEKGDSDCGRSRAAPAGESPRLVGQLERSTASLNAIFAGPIDAVRAGAGQQTAKAPRT